MAPKLLVGFLLVSISCISRRCGDSRWGLPELQGLTSDLLALLIYYRCQNVPPHSETLDWCTTRPIYKT